MIFRIYKRTFLYLFGFISFLSSIELHGQFNQNQSSNTNSNSSIDQIEYSGPDTSYFRYFTLSNRNKKTPAVDTFLHGLENYAHEKQAEKPALTLGNFGSASLDILYDVNKNIGNRYGFNQYDIYHKTINDFRFYELNTAYNDLFFSPVGGQSNFLVKAKFSRNFKNNTNIALDYQRINQEGFYTNQDTKITSFGIGIWNQSENKKRNSFFRLIATNNNEAQNGGVSNRDEFDDNFNSSRFNINVNLSDANSRLERYQYLMDNFWDVSNFQFKHSLRYEHGFYRFTDVSITGFDQSQYYGIFKTEDRGIRINYGSHYVENDFAISFNLKKHRLTGGIEYDYKTFDIEAEVLKRSDLFLYGDLKTDFGIVAFEALAKTGLLDANGNFLLDASANFPISKWFELNGGFSLSRYNAFINQEVLAINHTILDTFTKTWNKQIESKIFVNFKIPKTNTSITWTALGLEDIMFLNGDSFYEQNDGSILGTQISVAQDLSWKFIHFNNSVHYQTFDNNIWHLPSLFSRHELYVSFALFKRKLDVLLGSSLSFTKYEEGIGFSPMLGTFYPTDRISSDLYPYSEIYANFKIDDFRVFIKFENALDYYLNDINFHIEDYPQYDLKFRLGVAWFLRN